MIIDYNKTDGHSPTTRKLTGHNSRKSIFVQTTIRTNIHTANIIFTYIILMADKHNIPKGKAPNDTAYKRWSCHNGLKLLCKLCRTSPPPAIGARFTVFWACRPCGPTGWLALLLTKAGDVRPIQVRQL